MDDVDVMPAGRELDVLVAVLMGWTETPNSLGPYYLFPPEGSTGRREGRVYSVAHYSTNIEKAWLVVEHLKGRECNDDYSWCWPVELAWLDDRGIWSVRFVDEQGRCIEGTGETAPLAICRAALKAVRQPIDAGGERV